jgi:hypothetical protein
LLGNHHDRVRMEQLCCLALLGEISVEDQIVLDQHLKECAECRNLLKDLEQIALVDLSVAAARRMEAETQPDLDLGQEGRLFAQVVERSRHADSEDLGKIPVAPILVLASPVPLRNRVLNIWRSAYPAVGWAVAALVVLGWGLSLKRPIPTVAPRATVVGSSSRVSQTELDGWKTRALSAEEQKEAMLRNLDRAQTQALATTPSLPQTEVDGWRTRALSAEERMGSIQRDLDRAQAQVQAAALALSHATDEYQKLAATGRSLEAQVAQQEEKLHQQASSLSMTQASLDEERSKAATLQAKLQEVNTRLDRQRTEVAHLQEVAASVPPRMPTPGQDMNLADAREIFGARDLHIVDVYDVDHAGKSSLAYGRIYYVNRHLLLFYAFDLANKAKKNRKPVAFQVWGFRQPNSTKAESLGLFYLDDAKLDRWVLRVSDPRLLARIDTLFVTVEPPGGSNSPKGHELLLASLAGPPNHP